MNLYKLWDLTESLYGVLILEAEDEILRTDQSVRFIGVRLIDMRKAEQNLFSNQSALRIWLNEKDSTA
jgi:hypothetical protein